MPTTAEQQLALELINRARADPSGEFEALVLNAAAQQGVQGNITMALQYFNVDLDLFQQQLSGYATVPPLAWNDTLATSAATHSDLMIQYDVQTHTTPGELGLVDRFLAAGYVDLQLVSESVYAYAQDILYAHAGFFIDWGAGIGGMQTPAGHREAILNGNFTEVGIDWSTQLSPGSQIGPNVTTQHFGTTYGYEAKLIGVVIDDLDNDDFYDIGEGMGGITITAVGTNGTFVTTSWASGGYQIVLPDGIYTVTFSGGALDGTITQEITIAGDNVKLDAQADEADTIIDLVLVGSAGNDEILGGEGLDTIRSMQGDDIIYGGAGADQIWGASGDDTINGGTGDDTLRGGPDQDLIYGGEGDDFIRGQKHSDDLYGGSGDDNIKGGGGNDLIEGGADGDFLTGGTRFDVIYGGEGNDAMYGNAHDDSLFGGVGDDLLNGGGGNDHLIGGAGADDLKGGNGADVFIFDVGHNADTIRDFDIAEDTLQISASLAAGLTASEIAASATLVTGGAMLDFGNGDTITLSTLTDLTALEDAILIA